MVYFWEAFNLKPFATFSGIIFWLLIFLLFHASFRRKVCLKFFSTNNITQIQSFDALRGFAALAVFIGHSWHWSYPVFKDVQISIPALAYISDKAVPVFAMLSGFLIHRQLQINYTKPTTQNIRRYFLRRFFRIYPLYIVCFVLFCLASNAYSMQEGIKPIPFMVSDFFSLRLWGASAYGNPVTWTLYVEMLFYLVAPLIVWGIPKKNLLSVLSVACLILVIADQGPGQKELWLIKYFLLGMIAFKLSEKFIIFHPHRLGYLFVALGTIFLLFDLNGPAFDIFNQLHLVAQKPTNLYTLGLGLSFGLILIGLLHAPIVAALLNFKPLRVLGLISYSVYLLHPIYLMLNFPEMQNIAHIGSSVLIEQFETQQKLPNGYFWGIFVVGLIPWALVSYWLIEQPFLKRKADKPGERLLDFTGNNINCIKR
jgi:peptidoglycan/LPS O-acetylase OafA/YrhL